MLSKCCNKKGRVIYIELFHQVKRPNNTMNTYGNELKTITSSYQSVKARISTKQAEIVSGDNVINKTAAYLECNYFDGLLVNDIIKFIDRGGKTQVFIVTKFEDVDCDNKTYKIEAYHDSNE